MTQTELKQQAENFEKKLIDLQDEYRIKLYAANVAIGEPGNQEVVPMIKFRFLPEVEKTKNVVDAEIVEEAKKE